MEEEALTVSELLKSEVYKNLESQEHVSQEQIHELLFSDELSWQAIIYDLVNSEQLDPWDLDISILVEKFLEKVQVLEEANFIFSGKILLAATLLHRLKTEYLVDVYLRSIDEILLGKKDEERKPFVRIELDEDEIPILVPRTPIPRFRRVTLEELMKALNKAINTESRRIKRHLLFNQARHLTDISLPKKTINIHDHINSLYARVMEFLRNDKLKTDFTTLVKGKSREEKIITFVSLLHLENQDKLWLEQNGHFEEIYIWLSHVYKKQNPLADRLIEDLQEEEKIEEIESFLEEDDEVPEFDNKKFHGKKKSERELDEE